MTVSHSTSLFAHFRQVEDARVERTKDHALLDIINFEAVTKYGVKAEGNAEVASAAALADLAQGIDQG